jgi:hypothetical protein
MEQINNRLGPPKFRAASGAGLLIPVLLLACLPGWASPEGSISGTAVDPSEAVIPGVTVVISNLETGMQQTTTTNSDGFFSVSALPPGQYQIEAHQSGFRPVLRSEAGTGAAEHGSDGFRIRPPRRYYGYHDG